MWMQTFFSAISQAPAVFVDAVQRSNDGMQQTGVEGEGRK